MTFDEVLINYKNMSISDKRNANISNLKFMIAFLEKICDDKNIDYRSIKSKEILELNNGKETEDDYLEAEYVYISVLKEMLGAYLDKTI